MGISLISRPHLTGVTQGEILHIFHHQNILKGEREPVTPFPRLAGTAHWHSGPPFPQDILMAAVKSIHSLLSRYSVNMAGASGSTRHSVAHLSSWSGCRSKSEGHGVWLSWYSADLACTEPRVSPLMIHESDVVMQACNHSTQGVEAGGS